MFLRFNYINNLIIPGADTRASTPLHIASSPGSPSEIYLHIEGNIFEGHDDQTADNRLFIDRRVFDGQTRVRVVDRPYELPPVATHPAAALPGIVLPTVGASLPTRDAIDTRYIHDVITRDGRIIDTQTELGGWPELKTAPHAVDTDGDGMPDSWETRHAFDPRNPADGAQDADGDGYTNVEEYLNNTHPRAPLDYTKAENNVDTTHATPKL
ncbi:MAG: hypothetical protein LBI02_06805 [Opitutaceae bacterium]|nr:hypothetical protein [Opitutaceae bacterium]